MRPAAPFHAVVVALVCLASCKGEPPRVATPDLAGSWRNEQGATLSFQDTGAVMFGRPDPKARPVIGEYTFDGETVTFRFRPESKWCSEETGTYRIELAPGSFVAVTVRDACKERERLVKGRWERTAEGRVTPDA